MMKHLLFCLLFFGASGAAFAQNVRREAIRIYPNPVTEFLSLSEGNDAEKMSVINILGRQIRRFEIDSTINKYYIGDLPRGIFLLRIEGKNGNVLQTIRINKISP